MSVKEGETAAETNFVLSRRETFKLEKIRRRYFKKVLRNSYDNYSAKGVLSLKKSPLFKLANSS